MAAEETKCGANGGICHDGDTEDDMEVILKLADAWRQVDDPKLKAALKHSLNFHLVRIGETF